MDASAEMILTWWRRVGLVDASGALYADRTPLGAVPTNAMQDIAFAVRAEFLPWREVLFVLDLASGSWSVPAAAREPGARHDVVGRRRSGLGP